MSIAGELGMGEIVLRGELFDLHRAKEVFKDVMHHHWSNKIGNMPKLGMTHHRYRKITLAITLTIMGRFLKFKQCCNLYHPWTRMI